MHGLEKKYQGALAIDIRNAFDPQSKKEIAGYGFETHGMVIFDASNQVAQKLNGHLLDEPTISKAVQEVLGQ